MNRLLKLVDRHQWLALAGIAACLVIVSVIEGMV